MKPFTNFEELLSPVPTAVPPWAKNNNSLLDNLILFKEFLI